MTSLSLNLPNFYQSRKKYPLLSGMQWRYAPGRGYYQTPRGQNPYYGSIYNRGAAAVGRAGQAGQRGLPTPTPGTPRPPVAAPRPGIPGIPGMNLGIPGGNIISSLYSPLFQQLAAQEKAAQGRASEIYTGHSDALAKALGEASAPLAGIYGGAVQQGTAMQEAIANRLSGVGQQQGESLAAKLAQIQAPGNQGAALTQTYQGLSNAGFASGMSDVQRLMEEGAHAQEYAAKLPGIGRISASKDLGRALGDISSMYGQQRQSLMQEIPQAALSLYQQIQDQKQAQSDQRSQERMAALALGDEKAAREMERRWEIQDRNYAANLKMQLEQMGMDSAAAKQLSDQAFQEWKTTYTQSQQNARSAASIKARGKGEGGGSSPVQTRLKRNKAISLLDNEFFNPQTRMPRQSWGIDPTTPKGWGKKGAAVASRVNQILDRAGIPRDSQVGIQIRSSYLRQFKIKVGPGGYPSYP